MSRPFLFVLAGVNGAGKSSIGGYLLRTRGFDWFNPDEFARELAKRLPYSPTEANAAAWEEGRRRLQLAIEQKTNHAFETTLGGSTIPLMIREATATHDVFIWFCGLDSAEHHIDRVRSRVAAGGHDIPEQKIRERYTLSILNLINLLPVLSRVQIYDNSADAALGTPLPNPRKIAEIRFGQMSWPTDTQTLSATPNWAKPILVAATLE